MSCRHERSCCYHSRRVRQRYWSRHHWTEHPFFQNKGGKKKNKEKKKEGRKMYREHSKPCIRSPWPPSSSSRARRTVWCWWWHSGHWGPIPRPCTCGALFRKLKSCCRRSIEKNVRMWRCENGLLRFLERWCWGFCGSCVAMGVIKISWKYYQSKAIEPQHISMHNPNPCQRTDTVAVAIWSTKKRLNSSNLRL